MSYRVGFPETMQTPAFRHQRRVCWDSIGIAPKIYLVFMRLKVASLIYMIAPNRSAERRHI